MEEALAFAAEGKVKAIVERHPLDSINEIFERLKTGRVNGRVVLAIGDHGSAQDRFR
jgi:alcohol dehydrogenase, propanol-preferring